MTWTTLHIDIANGIAHLWLNRPEVHNAFDEHVVAELTVALRELDADPAVRVVVLAGRGNSFCAGADLGWMRRMAGFGRDENLTDARALAEMLRTLASLSKPTIARVHGAALAGGTGLVACCDLAVATPDASFGATEVRLGLLPATIAPYLIRAIGERAARRYFLTAERFHTEQALRLGLVHVVAAEDALDAAVARQAAHLLAGAPGALAAGKRLVADVAGQPITAALIADTCERIAEARAGDEAREGIAAFFEKRAPSWRDR